MWRMVWLDRPATKIIQFQKDGEVCGSVSLIKEDVLDIKLFEFLQSQLDKAEKQDDKTDARIN